ncbi:DNA-binding transcriptional activator of the SARP family [Sinosporangium album]|uniref:DNA-binding transcriptional activator of the SARP family n=1 Tax=Sinosporangium album TaxID=504805 RepID=A0A1G7YCW6_9ACTN|nr:AfsR/SARP family transcriptional regulator [Sinosporangium album]SDG94398.1 DNA-binding transcriptional activator of the SARP family [Sinosporangium album]
MKYEVLGSLRVVKDGRALTVTAPKMEIVLATMLIRADHVVSIEQLITEIWGSSPPRRATAALYVYVSQLRKLLTGSGGEKGPILTRAPGYVLRTSVDELDLHVFQRLIAEGREHKRHWRYDEARVAFEKALALWRGRTLSNLREGPIITGFVHWLEEVRLECNEMLVEVNLRLGRHRELVSVLHGLVREYPLHEQFYRQLMLALYRSERRADALAVYQSARATLNRELGLEPGWQLGEMQQSILAADAMLDLETAV